MLWILHSFLLFILRQCLLSSTSSVLPSIRSLAAYKPTLALSLISGSPWFCWEASLLGGDCPPRASQQRASRGLNQPETYLSHANQPIVSLCPSTSLSNAHTPIFSLPEISPRPSSRQPETTHIAQSWPELFKAASPKLFSLPCFAFPGEAPKKAQPQTFLWCYLGPLDGYWCFFPVDLHVLQRPPFWAPLRPAGIINIFLPNSFSFPPVAALTL